ncbi:MAG: glycosyltransferase [Pseudomonadota bacterium]
MATAGFDCVYSVDREFQTGCYRALAWQRHRALNGSTASLPCPNNMRILMNNSHASYTLGPVYQRSLKRLGHEVHDYWPAIERQLLPSRLAERAMDRVLPNIKMALVRRDLLAAAEALKPDVVWIMKGADIDPATIEALKSLGPRVVNFNADHPFEFYTRGTGNARVAAGVPHYDAYLTYSRRIEAEIRARHPGLQTGVLPFGHEVDEAFYAEILRRTQEECLRVVFAGNPDPQRVAELGFLVAEGFDVDVYGKPWQSIAGTMPRLNYCGDVTGHETYAVFRRYRVALNFFRPHNIGSHNLRSFEIPAVGGILLAPDSEEHREFFTAGKEAFYYTDRDSMVAELRRVLALPEADARKVREAARWRSVNAGYHFDDRAREAAQLLLG